MWCWLQHVCKLDTTDTAGGWIRWLHKLRPLLDTYHQPYNSKFRYWPGVLLMVRIVLFVTFACNINGNPSLNLVAILITVLVLLLLCWNSRRVYKNYLLSIMESFFLLNLGLLSSFTLFFRSTPPERRSSVTVNISVGLSFVTFCVILVYHCYQQFRVTFTLSRIAYNLQRNLSVHSTTSTITQWKFWSDCALGKKYCNGMYCSKDCYVFSCRTPLVVTFRRLHPTT